MEPNRRRAKTTATPAEGPLDVGTLLRLTRRRRRISLDRAAIDTCIPRRYIEALERNYPAESFPGAVYARGFLRTYARYLRMTDIERLLARFDASGPPPIEPLVEAVPPPGARRGRTHLVLLVAALVGAAIIVGTSGDTRPVNAGFPGAVRNGRSASAAEPVVPVDPETALKAAAATQATVGSLAVTIEVAEARSWLRVVADGDVVLTGRVVGPAFSQRFTARRALDILVGNAGAVRVFLGERWQGPIGGAGQVRRILFTLSDGTAQMRVTRRP